MAGISCLWVNWSYQWLCWMLLLAQSNKYVVYVRLRYAVAMDSRPVVQSPWECHSSSSKSKGQCLGVIAGIKCHKLAAIGKLSIWKVVWCFHGHFRKRDWCCSANDVADLSIVKAYPPCPTADAKWHEPKFHKDTCNTCNWNRQSTRVSRSSRQRKRTFSFIRKSPVKYQRVGQSIATQEPGERYANVLIHNTRATRTDVE